MNAQVLLNQVSKMPLVNQRVDISEEEFDKILMNPELTVVEKHFHSNLETNQVLFVISDNEIEYVAVKEVTADGTRIYKEV